MRAVDTILYKEIRASTLPLVSVLLLMLLAVGFDLVTPWPFKILIDNVLSANPPEPGTLLAYIAELFPSRDLLGFFAVFAYFFSTLALALVEYTKSIFTKRVIKRLTATFSKEAFQNLQTLAIGFYNKQKIGDYIYRLGYDVSALGEFLEEGILPIIASCLYLIVVTIIMCLISVQLTLLSLVVLPFLAVGLYIFNARIGKATRKSELLNSVTFSFIEETLKHLKVIQAFSQEKKKAAAFDKRIERSLWSDIAVYRLDFLISLGVGIVIAISYSTIMLYGIHAVFSGTLTTGLLIVFIFYLDNLTTPLVALIYAVTATRQSYEKISRMNEFFTSSSHLEYHKGAVKKLTGADVRFEHVTLLGDGNKKILSNVSFTIEAGKRTAIFGVSGSGKTSVINLIMRFIEKPTHGHIYIGGTAIEDYDIDALRQTIAYVPQEITIFDDTIRNNIVFGNKHHTWKNIHRATRLAEADEFIKKLPGKFQFRVGEGGVSLSGGQRQRIMLARALMKEHAKILILDETFSALDVKTRAHLLRNLKEFSEDKTTIFISNIFDVITEAENIIVFNRGRLLYSGKASRLPKEISLYKMIIESEEVAEE